ncbi:11039_t:CDS:2, partial [Racocetra fulgida]
SEKLAVICKAKKISVLAALPSFYLAAEEELIKWLNKLHLAGIAVIAEAWADIPIEMITRLFKKCGISNELDGTEDNLLYDLDKENYNSEDSLEIVNED